MDTDGGVQAELPGSAGSGSEPLACVTCRFRKLKCDRVRPACSRCLKVKGECVYPESRRKPAFKRKNVKELEERLAQVEDLLKEAGKAKGEAPTEGDLDSRVNVGMDDFHVDLETLMAMQNGTFGDKTDFFTGPPGDGPQGPSFAASSGELMGLGLSEALPPFEMMEELNKCFFERQQHFIPIIHPGRYLQSFYSAPHKRPPMCLQYAVWSMASNGHEKYSQYHEIFYKRARQYADADEMRGFGEHFLTVQHAQAWALIATDEARSLFFTRAAMSSAKCVRLVEMMGLHRVDGDGQEMAPTLAPPTSWVDLEERRRAFWGAYCIDCHASIATGWPTLIDPNEISTHLPSSEEAFNSAREETTSTLSEAFKGASYSTFAGAVVTCHIFNKLLKHVHWERPNDRPMDVEYGEFWNRHRDIDNMLSSAFMFLPERFRLPQSMRDPTAVHMNLNLHASVICLHHAAIDRIEKHKLPDNLKAASQLRLRTAAEEVVSIVKLTSHMNSGYKSPMVALSLYSAASVYVYSAKCDPEAGISPVDLQNLNFIITAMEAIGRKHVITQAFLQQIFMDVERNGLSGVIDLPNLTNYKNLFGWTYSNIPLLARSSISKHTEIQPPLPGRLPLGNPKGTAYDNSLTAESYEHNITMEGGCNPLGPNPANTYRGLKSADAAGAPLGRFDRYMGPIPTANKPSDNGSNKRRRTSPTISPEEATHVKNGVFSGTFTSNTNGRAAAPASSNGIDGVGGFGMGLLRGTGMMKSAPSAQMNLPHRTPPASAPSPSPGFNKNTPSQSTGSSTDNTPPGFGRDSTSPDDGSTQSSYNGGGNANEIIDITSIQNAMMGGAGVGAPTSSSSTWDSRGLQYAPSTDPGSFMNMNFDSMPPGLGIDPWTMLANMEELTWIESGEVTTTAAATAAAAAGDLNGTGGV
ncbi:citrinin biosynthesis transcriptional activator ctnR [Colletotrichum spaethianum]|uniref:Citrinin biosynthesis transcriptional activator ctnR n=1 Tax=Colletotrichum spaethianum TaxID=700344 RepID=A0AA37LDM3_9PEZI|nr:citrinin biosynthesis transcriptional activator ctnR [Colletotrichum spaethianum]GKT46706.1 citrinin biosynthesis transcriptional activator ctnR [Colletotrichum spaethianum]